MASYLSWSRAAYVFFVLAVLAALLKIGGVGLAQQKILAAEQSDPETTIELSTPENATSEATTSEQHEATVEQPAPIQSSKVMPPTGRPAKPARAATDTVAVKRAVQQEKPATVGDAPVFYRPSRSAAPTAIGAPASSGPVCGDLGNFPKSSKAIFPLSDLYFDSYDDTWGAPRPQGGHEGTDLMVPDGTPEYAVTDGTIVPVSGANGRGWNTLGGYTVMLRADYDMGPIEAGDIFYYAHMRKPSTLKIGTRVRAGEVVGYAGDTGQGTEITRGLFPPHLHFGWYDVAGSRSGLESGAMNPFPLLNWLKTNGGAVSGGSDARYCKAPLSGPPVPSSGGGSWNYPSSPGVRPDLDTGPNDGRPSPIVKKNESSAERAPGSEKPGEDSSANRPKRPNEDRNPDRPSTGPRPPETTIPEIGVPKPPGAVIPHGPATFRPKVPGDIETSVPTDQNGIRNWVHEIINRVVGTPDEARPNVHPKPADAKHEKPGKHETPERPKHRKRQAPKGDPACKRPETGNSRTGEPCRKRDQPKAATAPAEPVKEETTPDRESTDTNTPDEPDTETPNTQTPNTHSEDTVEQNADAPATDVAAPDAPPVDSTDSGSSPEPVSGESTTEQ